MLNKDTNYIVSGLERSGTSLMMQILQGGGVPVAFDDSRKADINNPKGYFELYGGKIINELMQGTFNFKEYRGQFIKITAYGLKWIPCGQYKIIYMMRNIDEILASMSKMGAEIKEDDRHIFEKLNQVSIHMMEKRSDIEFVKINYNKLLYDNSLLDVLWFLDGNIDIDNAEDVIDARLYRNRGKL